ncbi:Y-family DNA polymerase [Desulfovibrio desulfuricans]|uniref:Y-family DNA polymerase n=1 Tax=Desulfovibrio desulfuricans TaxID=876 RepID=A0A4P7UKI4_DESDE|nr:Y-family DNA polymerase [Desulfovibrio desulfuricans]QCC85101.1 Y-family DNA polymerase [Desulfovibrio desulfuricans]
MSSTSCESPASLWALVDCNNFYASCEKLFRPDLAARPVVVLSNNDGCIVSRSAEAKALGVPMGAPEFKLRSWLQELNAVVFSSNYTLYGDISARVVGILEQCCQQVEPYSIDEAFMRLDAPQLANLPEFCRDVRQRIQRWTGIAVSVGVGSTRTLAKIATHVAKKHAAYEGVFSLVRHEEAIDRVLARTPVEDIWGVGRRQARRLWAEGIRTALHMKNADDVMLRRLLTVTGWRTALELRGIPCLGNETAPVVRKTLMSTRSFAHRIHDKAMLAQALSTFAVRAAARLRGAGLVASGLAVHIRTARPGQAAAHERLYDQTAQCPLPVPTADSQQFIHAALGGLDRIFLHGYAYAKAGVMLYGLERADSMQGSLLALAAGEDADGDGRRKRLMRSLDAINGRFGRDTIIFGAQGMGDAPWHMRQEHRSPRMTTCWDELPLARC